MRALLDLFPNAGPRLGETLALLPIAGEEADRARLLLDQREAVWPALFPSPVLRGRGELLYRAHVRELLRRASHRAHLEPGTDAECLGLMMETALRAPLNAEGQAVAEHLFAKLFPEKGRELVPDGPAREKWAGQLVAQAERELAPRPVRRRASCAPRRRAAEDHRPRRIGLGTCACGRTEVLFHSKNGPGCAACVRSDGEES